MSKNKRLPGAVWILAAVVTVIGAQAMVPSVLVADVAETIGLSVAATGSIFAAYGLALASCTLATALRPRRRSPRSRLFTGLLTLAVALIVIALSSNGEVLTLGVVSAGLGAGLALPAAYGLVPVVVEPEYVAVATGRVLMGWALALVLGVPVAGVVAVTLTWRGSFLVLAAASIIAAGCCRALPTAGAALTTSSASGSDAARAGLEDALRADSESPPDSIRAVLRSKGSVGILIAVAAFMGAFYGTFAFAATAARAELQEGPLLASGITLAFGLGFSGASAIQPYVVRFERVALPVLFAVLVVLYAVLPIASESVLMILSVAALWGFVNENTLTALVSHLARGPAPQAALSLYNTVTYLAAAAGIATAGVLTSNGGFTSVGLAAAATCLVGLASVLVVRTSSATSDASSRPESPTAQQQGIDAHQ